MDKEELLAEAKRRYPLNCNYISAYSGNNKFCSGDLYYNNGDIQDSNTNYVYYNNKWAEIISTPTENLLNNLIIW